MLTPTPSGTRWVVEARWGRVEGERLSGVVTGGANADWFLIGPDLVGTVDARLLVETGDGALVLLQYGGRTDLSAGGTAPIYIAPRFETGDERYRWLNAVQAVGKGSFDAEGLLVYQLFEVR